MAKLFTWTGTVMDLGCGYTIDVERPVKSTRAVNLRFAPQNIIPSTLIKIRLLDTADLGNAQRIGLHRMYLFVAKNQKALNTDFFLLDPAADFQTAAMRLALALEFQKDPTPPEPTHPVFEPEQKKNLLNACSDLCRYCKDTPNLPEKPYCRKCMVGYLRDHIQRDGEIPLP